MSRADEDLLRRCAAGDTSAWLRLVRDHAGLVFAIARRAGAPHDVCEDVAQIVFATLSRRIGSIRDPGGLASWLATTTRREAWRALRRARRGESEAAPGVTEPAADDTTSELLRHQELRTALEELGGRCRELLTLLYLRDPPVGYEQISDVLTMPVGSIGPTRRRCLEKLAGILGEGGSKQ